MSTELWSPSTDYLINSSLWKYKEYIESHYNLTFSNYADFQNWSILHLEDFWESLLHYFQLTYDNDYSKVCDWSVQAESFIDVHWFSGIDLSYAEHIFKQKTHKRPAIKFANETGSYEEIAWEQLAKRVSSIQQYLLSKGVVQGDRVVGVLNNTADTIAIFLAVNSLGAIWSCCSPDFGDKSIADRFAQIEPKLLFIQTSYQYNNKVFSKVETSAYLLNRINTITEVIELDSDKWKHIFLDFKATEIAFQRVPFSHPIWILYSSGTTGIPKAITHSTGGNLIEHYKALALHQNVQEDDNFLWYTTTGWMMWNYALSSLLCGATLCLFDGIINHNNHQTFWTFLKQAKVNHLGAGAVYFSSLLPVELEKLNLKVIASTGSPLPPETFEYLSACFPDTPIISLSGGTDVCSAFLSGCSMLPIYAGQLQCKTLGAAIEAFNENGDAVIDEVGELVLTKPMPCMPLYFWNDQKNVKYKESYFDKFKGVWAHGDWIKIIPTEGIIIYGRSDATLNRGGVRIGTAEIYNTVNSLEGIKDSLVITVDNIDGTATMILFVQLQEYNNLNDQLSTLIKSTLRTENSPRHVPDIIYQVKDIPYTLSGKKLELPIKRIFSGVSFDKAVSIDIMRNPECLSEYLALGIS